MLKENIPKSIDSAKKSFLSGKLNPSDLVSHYIKVIEEKNKQINAVLEVFTDAREFALIADKKYKDGTARKLEGIPFLVKDCILVKGHISSAGSRMLENYVAPYDATVVKKILEEGGIILGRTNMDEFALGGSGENSSYGKTLNPIDINKVPGGSSSGSAAALASGMCLVALGSDTGGSVRQPASFCGLYGFKPSYGSLSRSGLIAAASSLDTIGILANNIEDVKYVYDLVAGSDIMDNTTIPNETRMKLKDINTNEIIAYPKEYIESEGVNEEVKRDFYNSLKKFESLGYTIKEVSIPDLKFALSVYYILNTAEVSTNLSRMDGLRFGGGEVGEVSDYQELFSKNRGKFLGPEVKRRIMIGSYVLSHGYYDAFYGKAKILQARMKKAFDEIFKEASFIALPTAPTTAFSSGEIKDPLTLYLEDIFTVPANLLGVPAISVPTSLDSNNMPMSIQIMSSVSREESIFELVSKFKS